MRMCLSAGLKYDSRRFVVVLSSGWPIWARQKFRPWSPLPWHGVWPMWVAVHGPVSDDERRTVMSPWMLVTRR